MNVEPMDEHNQALVDNTHPATHRNPEPRNPYNLVVIGAGTAGLVSAVGAAGLGARVALVERHLMGGDCLNFGCVPSKGLIRAATAVADARGASKFGVDVGSDLSVDFAAVMKWVRQTRATISSNDSVSRMEGLGIDVFLGEGQFVSNRAVEVDGKLLKFSKAVIATGARAWAPPVPGLHEVGFLTNETVFSLTEQPARVAVIGGGPIGSELSQSFARLGSQVTLFEMMPQLLGKDDADAAEVVRKALVRDGVNVLLQVKLSSVEQRGNAKVIKYVDPDGAEAEAEFDEVLVSAGRRPNVAGIGLEKAGVSFDERKGVIVDDRLRTTNSRIYAAGDVASKYQFTHAADFLARTVLKNALFPGRAKASALTIPWATYTDPQVSHVGLTAQMARESGIEVDTYTKELDDVDRAIVDGDTEGFVRVHVRQGTDEIVGATIVARHAGDMIGELTMAMTHKIGLGSVANVIHPYPTQAEAIRHTGDAFNRTRLTARVKRMFEWWLGWQRGGDEPATNQLPQSSGA